jgi:pilus assembly protein Flp/PilA
MDELLKRAKRLLAFISWPSRRAEHHLDEIGRPVGSVLDASRKPKGVGSMRLAQAVVRFLEKEDGPTAVEYAVMLALIIVVCITAITSLGSNANKTFNNVALNTAVASGS